jgi:hypothetical protein
MGMFDWIEWEGNRYQTKDTPRQFCDNYRIDDLGRLWVEEYDAEWVKDPGHIFGAYIKQTNHRWVECEDFTGPMRFYRDNQDQRDVGSEKEHNWQEWEAEFKCGCMIGLKLIEGDRFLEWYHEAIEQRGLE